VRITPDVIREEFIGLDVEVVKSSHAGYVGIKGRIIDETRNTFLVLSGGRRKRIPKANCTFHFHFPDGTVVEIEGQLLVGRPEDRIKKRIKRRW